MCMFDVLREAKQAGKIQESRRNRQERRERAGAPGPSPERCAPCWNAAQYWNLEKCPPPPSAAWELSAEHETRAAKGSRVGGSGAQPRSRRTSSRDASRRGGSWVCQSALSALRFQLTSCGAAVFPPPPTPLLVLPTSPREDVPPLLCCPHPRHPPHGYHNLTWWDYDPSGIKTWER